MVSTSRSGAAAVARALVFMAVVAAATLRGVVAAVAADDRVACVFAPSLPDAERLAALDELLAEGVRPVVFAPLLHDRCEALVAQLLRRADPEAFPEAVERAVELLIAGGGEALKHQALLLIRRRAGDDDAERLFAAAVQYDGTLARHALRLVETLPVEQRARLLAAALTETSSLPSLRVAARLACGVAMAAVERVALISAAQRRVESGEEARIGVACGIWLALDPISPLARNALRTLARSQRDERRFAAMEACQVELPDRARDFALDLVAERLEDVEWPVRKAAIEAAGALQLPRAAPLLLARMEQERERSLLLRDAARALRRLTGAPLRDTAGDWRRWLADHPDFVPPSRGEVDELEARLERQARSGTGGDFFAVPVRSDRVMLLIDASGSMGADGKLERACAEAAALIDALPSTARLNLLFFDSHLRQFAAHAQMLDAPTRARARRFLEAQAPGGGTNLHGALVAALDDPEVDTVYLLSDGAPSSGTIRDPLALRRDIARRNRLKGVVIHAISQGGDRELLAGLAQDSGGTLR